MKPSYHRLMRNSAYAPDLPGCVATGKTVEEVKRHMHEAIEMHIRGLLEDSLPVPASMPCPRLWP
ncbi:MAG: type II toxin-antitoxin system HicB family antitoxin [Anaerolineae bacterium]|nr:type II toxin-antitoxin system HicB family antitoxin [Anaerolineae bacterium]